MAQLSTENLANLIAKRHQCLTQMLALGQKQAELISAGNMESLLRLLSAKSQLLVALQAIEKELAPFHDQAPEERAWSSELERTKCSNQAEECRNLLQEVMELEQRNEETMRTRRDKVANQLQAAQSASTARGAYQIHQKHANQSVPNTFSSPTTTTGSPRLDLHSNA